MPDAFSTRTRGMSDPAVTIFDITPSDIAELPHVTTALNVTSPGFVRVTTADGSEGTVTVHPGQSFPIRVTRVWHTGTTATGIRGLV